MKSEYFRRDDVNRRYNDKGEVVEKKCSLCDEWKLIEEFVKDKSRKVDGYNSRCKKCVVEYKNRYKNGEISERGEFYKNQYDIEYWDKKKKK